MLSKKIERQGEYNHPSSLCKVTFSKSSILLRSSSLEKSHSQSPIPSDIFLSSFLYIHRFLFLFSTAHILTIKVTNELKGFDTNVSTAGARILHHVRKGVSISKRAR